MMTIRNMKLTVGVGVLAVLCLFNVGCLPEYHLQKGAVSGLFMDSPVFSEPGGNQGGIQLGIPLVVPLVKSAVFSDGSYLSTSGRTTEDKNVFSSFAPLGTGISFSIAQKGMFITQFEGRFGSVPAGIVYDLNMGMGIRLYNSVCAGRIVFNIGLARSHMDAYIIEESNTGFYDFKGTYFKPFVTYGLSYSFNMLPGRLQVDPIVQLSIRYGSLLSYETVSIDQLNMGFNAGIGKKMGNWQCFGMVGLNALAVTDIFKVSSMAMVPTVGAKITYNPKFRS